MTHIGSFRTKNLYPIMKHLKTNFQTFLKYKLNEKVNLKKKEEEEPIEDDNKEEMSDDENIEDIDEPIEEEEPLPPVKKSKKKEDTIDEMVKEYRKLQIEWDNLFKQQPKRKK
jgi:hypothetical protein